MANLGNFNANEVEPSVAFEPVPAGKYIAAITASAVCPLTWRPRSMSQTASDHWCSLQSLAISTRASSCS